jgi:hypothetical protein
MPDMQTRKPSRNLILRCKGYQAGVYKLTDTRNDPSWGDVEAVEEHRDGYSGRLISVINWRSFADANRKWKQLEALATN